MKLNSIKITSWLIAAIVAVIIYFPVISGLALTPIHNGTEVPTNALLLTSLIFSILIGIITKIIIQKWLLKKSRNT